MSFYLTRKFYFDYLCAPDANDFSTPITVTGIEMAIIANAKFGSNTVSINPHVSI